jgi:hypothetical protein
LPAVPAAFAGAFVFAVIFEGEAAGASAPDFPDASPSHGPTRVLPAASFSTSIPFEADFPEDRFRFALTPAFAAETAAGSPT